MVIATPDFHGKSRDVFRTADDAATEFERRVQELHEGAEGSGLYRVTLPRRRADPRGARRTRDPKPSVARSGNDPGNRLPGTARRIWYRQVRRLSTKRHVSRPNGTRCDASDWVADLKVVGSSPAGRATWIDKEKAPSNVPVGPF